MFLTLLAAATAMIAPTVTVNFGPAGRIEVARPGRIGDFEARDRTYFSPRGDAAAVQFCWDIPTMSPLMCQVKLVRPSGQVSDLKGGAVGPLLWTTDGRYLVGAGNNTVRLWNLSGGVRIHAPRAPDNRAGLNARTNRITRMRFENKSLCVSTFVEVFKSSGGYSVEQLSATTRYSLPTLRPLETVTAPIQEFTEAPCHMAKTEP